MSSIGRLAAMAAVLGTCMPAVALASSGTVQVIVGGEAYDGPPRFEVSFDGQVLGEAAVDSAIDTAAAGRFADAADKAAHVQSFSFDIPDGAFKPGAEVRVRLVNEAYGGDGSDRDRNLFLASVAVNGQAVTLSGLSTRGTSDSTENEVLGEFLVLRDGNVEGVSRAPGGGWPRAAAAVASAEPASASEPEVTAEAEPVAVRMPVSEPVATASLAATASAPAASPDPNCQRDELYNVIGFNESSNDLTPKLMQRLDQIVEDIGGQKCRVLVTGYSSQQGNHATNALFAIERAQNVLTYLKQAGLQFERASAAGGGATQQFGDTDYANRRVVISVGP